MPPSTLLRPRALRLSALLLLALAATTASATATAEATQPTGSHAVGALFVSDSGSLPIIDLDLSTSTDTLPGEVATHYQALAGDPVSRVYYLRNNGLLPLVDVSVQDPQASAIRCGPHGTVGVTTLPPLSETTCSATFTAVAGEHETTVTAEAMSPVLHLSARARDEAGYTAIAPGLSANLSLRSADDLPANSTVAASVTVTDTGSVELSHLTQVGAQPLSGFSCGSDGPVVEHLGPGDSAVCGGTLATAPGHQSVEVTVSGRWMWLRPITSQGLQTPRTLVVQAVAGVSYNGMLPPVMSPPSQQPRSAPTPSASPIQPSPAHILPPSPSPTPTLSPSRSPAPTPSPGDEVLAGTPRYPVSHPLPTPLKVLAIIVVPAIAVGRRALSSRSRSS